jgi:hypothetical protein
MRFVPQATPRLLHHRYAAIIKTPVHVTAAHARKHQNACLEAVDPIHSLFILGHNSHFIILKV